MVIVFNKLEVDIVWFVRLNGKNLTKNTQKQEMEKVFFGKKKKTNLHKMQCCKI